MFPFVSAAAVTCKVSRLAGPLMLRSLVY